MQKHVCTVGVDLVRIEIASGFSANVRIALAVDRNGVGFFLGFECVDVFINELGGVCGAQIVELHVKAASEVTRPCRPGDEQGSLRGAWRHVYRFVAAQIDAQPIAEFIVTFDADGGANAAAGCQLGVDLRDDIVEVQRAGNVGEIDINGFGGAV